MAQKKQFGVFLSDLDLHVIDKDYYHISKSHINNGNKTSIKNALRFFECVVHYDDAKTEIDECRSCKRREQRVNVLNSFNPNTVKEDATGISIANNSENKNIWSLKQRYSQNQLDTIHAFLVHSNWKYFIQRYSNQHDEDDQKYNSDNIKLVPSNISVQPQNKNRYVTDSYGFGIDHSHPHLKDKYCSLHDEMLGGVKLITCIG
eukprot:241244_1